MSDRTVDLLNRQADAIGRLWDELAEAQKLLAYLADQYGRVLEVHARVVMDTKEDGELHDRAVAAFREALAPITAYLAAVAGHPAGREAT